MLSYVAQSAKILSPTIVFKGNLAQPRKYCPTKYLGYTVDSGNDKVVIQIWYASQKVSNT